MAILKEIEVYVTVNGQVLQEYVDNEADDPPDSFTRYIEAHSDFEFVVHYKSLMSTNQIVCCRLSVDGFHIGSRLLNEQIMERACYRIKSRENGRWMLRPLKGIVAKLGS